MRCRIVEKDSVSILMMFPQTLAVISHYNNGRVIVPATLLQVLNEAAAADPRIVVEWRKENGGIASASNSALNLVNGDIVALMDHDDLLPEQALYEVAVELNAHPDAIDNRDNQGKTRLKGADVAAEAFNRPLISLRDRFDCQPDKNQREQYDDKDEDGEGADHLQADGAAGACGNV